MPSPLWAVFSKLWTSFVTGCWSIFYTFLFHFSQKTYNTQVKKWFEYSSSCSTRWSLGVDWWVTCVWWWPSTDIKDCAHPYTSSWAMCLSLTSSSLCSLRGMLQSLSSKNGPSEMLSAGYKVKYDGPSINVNPIPFPPHCPTLDLP